MYTQRKTINDRKCHLREGEGAGKLTLRQGVQVNALFMFLWCWWRRERKRGLAPLTDSRPHSCSYSTKAGDIAPKSAPDIAARNEINPKHYCSPSFGRFVCVLSGDGTANTAFPIDIPHFISPFSEAFCLIGYHWCVAPVPRWLPALLSFPLCVPFLGRPWSVMKARKGEPVEEEVLFSSERRRTSTIINDSRVALNAYIDCNRVYYPASVCAREYCRVLSSSSKNGSWRAAFFCSARIASLACLYPVVQQMPVFFVAVAGVG